MARTSLSVARQLGRSSRAVAELQRAAVPRFARSHAAVIKESNGQLWIGHETSEVPLRKYAPAYYE
jgi:hypothetical protein